MATTIQVYVWDLPTRLFHWLLAAAIPAALVTGFLGGDLIVWHGRLGLLILGLLVFRLAWGFIGSTNARFARFVRGPAAIAAYLRGEWQGHGHNPLGALAVLAMLGLIGVQVGSGLFANDDIAFRGPLADLIGDDLSSRLTSLHAFSQYLLIAMVVLHAAAITYYVRRRHHTLIRPMVSGYRSTSADHAVDAPAGPGRIALAFVLAALLAVFAVYAATGALVHGAPVASAPTPSW
jgi:cytochrome b